MLSCTRRAAFSARMAAAGPNGVPHLEHALALRPPLARHAGLGQRGFGGLVTGTGRTGPPRDLASIASCDLTAAGCVVRQRLHTRPFLAIACPRFQHAKRFLLNGLLLPIRAGRAR